MVSGGVVYFFFGGLLGTGMLMWVFRRGQPFVCFFVSHSNRLNTTVTTKAERLVT